MEPERVYGLYREPWPKEIVTSAVIRHPAKFSKGLIFWIVQAGIDRGWWKPGDTIIDPFGGVGLGAIPTTLAGMQWVGVELEEHWRQTAVGFDNCVGVDYLEAPRLCPDCRYYASIVQRAEKHLARLPEDDERRTAVKARIDRAKAKLPGKPHHMEGLFDLHRYGWEQLNRPHPILVQGDSRNLVEVLRPVLPPTPLNAISSPAYGNRVDDSGSGPVAEKNSLYGATPGQIGNFHGISSPPHGNTQPQSSAASVDLQKQYETYRASGGGMTFEQFVDQQESRHAGYGDTAGQIAKLGGVTSPPFGSPETRDRTPVQEGVVADFMTRAYTVDRQGDEATNIAALQLAPSEQKETYWDACIQVYQQAFSLFSPGGVFAVVVKGFSRNFTYIDLPKMTWDVLIDCGFEPVAIIEAMQIAAEEQQVMFQGEDLSATLPARGFVEGKALEPVRLSYKGFFRRNYEAKFINAPKIDSEFVLVVRKPYATN